MIYLLPLGNADRRVVVNLRAPLMEAFRRPVAVHESDMDIGLFHDGARLQYNSTRLLLHMTQNWPEFGVPDDDRGPGTNEKVLAISSEDLFVPILTYVFGEALLGGDAAVVSYHRLQNERYGLQENPDLMFQRLIKEAVHELGHTFGLVHCSDSDCVMRSSTDVEDIDLKEAHFCTSCAAVLESRL